MPGRTTDATRHAKRDAFLAAFARLGTITHAAAAASVHRNDHYWWMEHDAEYPHLFSEAGKQATDSLEREAIRRAVEGTEKPVYQGKELVGTIREYSDTLLIFLMKGALPSKYRERVEITMDVTAEAKRLAAELGLDESEVMAEVQTILGKR
jgi:hypothetical protein